MNMPERKEIAKRLVDLKTSYCQICDDSFDEVYSLANCENVCCKCCPNFSSCADCEYNY